MIMLSLIFQLHYICQVPGCGVSIKKPWNHIKQGLRHKGLSDSESTMYIELTKSVGKIDQESIMNPPPIQSSPLPPNPTPNNNDNDMGEETSPATLQ